MKRALAVAFAVPSILVILVLLIGYTLAYRPVVVAGPAVGTELAGVAPGGWPRAPGLRLHVFNTGMVRVSSIMVGSAAARFRPVPAFVLEHPQRGLIIYDCGMGLEVARRGLAALPVVLRRFVDVRARPERVLDAQMRAAGLDPGRVSAVIVSHIHFDHVGQVGAFPNAAVYAGAGIRQSHLKEWTASVPGPLDAIPAARFREVALAGTPPYATFDGSRDLFADRSVVLLPGGGHTREDLLALVMLPQGPALLAGDAIEHREWLDGDDVQRVPDLPERAAAVRNQARALLRADPGVLLVAGHDLADLLTQVSRSARSDVVLHRTEWFSLDAWPER